MRNGCWQPMKPPLLTTCCRGRDYPTSLDEFAWAVRSHSASPQGVGALPALVTALVVGSDNCFIADDAPTAGEAFVGSSLQSRFSRPILLRIRFGHRSYRQFLRWSGSGRKLRARAFSCSERIPPREAHQNNIEKPGDSVPMPALGRAFPLTGGARILGWACRSLRVVSN